MKDGDISITHDDATESEVDIYSETENAEDNYTEPFTNLFQEELEEKDEEVFETSHNEDPGPTPETPEKRERKSLTPRQTYLRKVGLDKIDADAIHYLKEYTDFDNPSEDIDTSYGVRSTGIRFFSIGDKTIHFMKEGISIGNNFYPGSPGLYELIFLKNPLNYSSNDLKEYKKILMDTKAHTVHYSGNKLQYVNMPKYDDVIKPMFTVVKGAGMNVSKPIYEYYDDGNELIDRLKLLIASARAGNNAHDNEILSIVEEMREQQIIL
jgi:hypothetical protein